MGFDPYIVCVRCCGTEQRLRKNKDVVCVREFHSWSTCPDVRPRSMAMWGRAAVRTRICHDYPNRYADYMLLFGQLICQSLNKFNLLIIIMCILVEQSICHIAMKKTQ